jgi:hypothetical protein
LTGPNRCANATQRLDDLLGASCADRHPTDYAGFSLRRLLVNILISIATDPSGPVSVAWFEPTGQPLVSEGRAR